MDNNQENIDAAYAIHIASLIHKVKENEPLNDQEQQELNEWLVQGHRHEEAFEELNDRKKFITEVREMNSYDSAEAANVIFDRLGLRAPDHVRKTQMLKTWLSAAAILLLLFSGIWFLVKEKGGKSDSFSSRFEPGPHYKNDLRPGSNKAMLTLADGSTIVLDSIHNGQLALQGNSKVINQNGHVVYHAGGNDDVVVYNTMTTPRGGQYQLVLPDGSKVWLNNVSSLKYPTSFQGKSREVELSGEAYFEIAKDAAKPFLVKVRDQRIEVLGTRFNIMAYEDENAEKTTLVEGLVKIVTKQNNSVIITPGQQAIVAGNAGDPAVQPADLEEVLAWTHGKFYFKESGIQAIMRQVSHWYDADVQFAGDDFSTIKFSGVISRKASVEELLEIIRSDGRLQFEVEGNRIKVLLKK